MASLFATVVAVCQSLLSSSLLCRNVKIKIDIQDWNIKTRYTEITLATWNVPKKIFNQELDGTRRRGRPGKKMARGSRKRSPSAGVRRWRELVADRKKWKDIVRQAKARSGL